MKAEIIAVGTELLLGQIVNTNAQYISQKLADLGIDVYYQTVVGDNAKRLNEALGIASGRAELLILTGGLGPTEDDITKQVTAEFCGVKCVLDENSKNRILEYFKKNKHNMTENNMRQAEMPEGCIILQNNNGTAPGAILKKGDTTIIILPGPPKEMKQMFDESVWTYLEKFSEDIIKSVTYRIYGIGESAVADKINDLFENSKNPTLATYAKEGEVEIRVTSKCKTEEECMSLTKNIEKELKLRMGEYIYGEGEDNSLEKVVCELLLKNRLKITTAESCTGGLVAKKITSVSGASECFDCGFVTYSNEKKSQLISVNKETLEKYGAVSKQTALEMCKGAMETAGADIGIGITGIAGPTGGTAEKPVGLVYIGICGLGEHKAYKMIFNGNRENVRERASMFALDAVRRLILKNS